MMYCSPEVCKGEQYTEKSDIYSLAIVFWEMINRCCKGKYEKPYAENNFENSIQIVMQTPKGLRPTLPTQAPRMILELVKDCWDNDQQKRPNTDQLLVRLEECQKDLLDNPYAWEQYEIRRPSIDSPELLHLSPASSFTPSPDMGVLR
jgi:serine/threonine protein kinase